MSDKTNPGNFFEDFKPGQVIRHATPRTVTEGEIALYTGLYGNRFALHSSDMFAMALGYEGMPVDDMLVFHIVFGKTVPDISLNAVANLGYADGRFLAPVYPGDTLRCESEVIEKRRSASRPEMGIFKSHLIVFNQNDEPVMEMVSNGLIRTRDPAGTD